MRFITEFSTVDEKWEQLNRVSHEGLLGAQIASSFGYNENGETTPSPGSPIKHKYKLEIEAFPMDKWIEFKKKLFAEIITCHNIDEPVRGEDVLKLIKELESFGKPVGAAKEM